MTASINAMRDVVNNCCKTALGVDVDVACEFFQVWIDQHAQDFGLFVPS